MDFLSPSTFILKQAGLSATPLLLAGFGELLAQRAGVINVGIEGVMLMGAIAGFGGAVFFGSAGAAIPAAIGVGLLFATLFAITVVWFGADQIVAGTAINLLAAGTSTTAWRVLQNFMSASPPHPAPPLYEPVRISSPTTLPVIEALCTIFSQYALFYVVVISGLILSILMTRSRVGLIIRSLGDAPDACAAAGIRVRWWRTGLLLFAGAAAGMAGAYLSTMRGHSFQINMTGGQGFLVLALVIFGRWNIPAFAMGAFAFGAIDGLQSYLASIPDATARIPHQLFDMLPYAATLLALAFLSRSRGGPIHLGRPWPDEV